MQNVKTYNGKKFIIMLLIILIPVACGIFAALNNYQFQDLTVPHKIFILVLFVLYGFLAKRISSWLDLNDSKNSNLKFDIDIPFSESEKKVARTLNNSETYFRFEIASWLLCAVGIVLYLILKNDVFILIAVVFGALGTIYRNFRLASNIVKKYRSRIQELEQKTTK